MKTIGLRATRAGRRFEFGFVGNAGAAGASGDLYFRSGRDICRSLFQPRESTPVTDSAFHPEDIARAAIDRSLGACGWVKQNRAEMNVGAGQGVAVREFQTDSGPVDYALFVDRRLCGVIEAKPEGTTLSGFSDQAGRYIAGAPDYLVREAG